MEFDGYAQSHFYGELTKTDEGCHLLAQKGHFFEFAEYIRTHVNKDLSKEQVMEMKAVLWAVVGGEAKNLYVPLTRTSQGNIGASVLGYAFLDDEDIVRHIIELAETSSVLSLRGYAERRRTIVNTQFHLYRFISERVSTCLD